MIVSHRFAKSSPLLSSRHDNLHLLDSVCFLSFSTLSACGVPQYRIVKGNYHAPHRTGRAHFTHPARQRYFREQSCICPVPTQLMAQFSVSGTVVPLPRLDIAADPFKWASSLTGHYSGYAFTMSQSDYPASLPPPCLFSLLETCSIAPAGFSQVSDINSLITRHDLRPRPVSVCSPFTHTSLLVSRT